MARAGTNRKPRPNGRLGPKDPSDLSGKGLDTRRRLITAARTIFDESGFVAARITDIADAAGTSHGSFYTYFNTKEEVFRAVVDEVLQGMNEATFAKDVLSRSPFEAIAEANARYYDSWVANSRTLLALDQAAGLFPDFYERLITLRRTFVDRYSNLLRELVAQGHIAADIDPYHAAGALAAMVEQSMRWWIGRGEYHQRELALGALNKIWSRGIVLQLDGNGPSEGDAG